MEQHPVSTRHFASMAAGKVSIEPIAVRHARRVQMLAADPAIGATSDVPSPYPRHGALHWIHAVIMERARGASHAFAILNEERVLVGVCSLVAVQQQEKTGELGYWIGRPYWGQGYATAAGRLVLNFAFHELGLEYVSANALEHNAASRRVLEKLGFSLRATGREHPKGPVAEYELRREQWRLTPG